MPLRPRQQALGFLGQTPADSGSRTLQTGLMGAEAPCPSWARRASVLQGGNPHGPTIVPSCVSTCGFYFREFFSIYHQWCHVQRPKRNPPRAGAGCVSFPQHSKDGASVLRVTPPKIFICSLYKCICTYTGMWASGWAVYFVNTSTDPVTESVRVLTSTSTSDQYSLHFVNKWISFPCNIELGLFCLCFPEK